MTAPGIVDLTIYQGATFRKRLIWKVNALPVDLTGFTARMQIRASTGDSTVLVELTTENGGIEITAIDGQIDLYIAADDTALLTFNTGVYDLELNESGEVTRLAMGKVYLNKEVTR